MSENTITIEEIVETDFGEKAAIDSPYEAKQFIKFTPWSEDDGVNYDELEDDTETPEFEFSDDFAAYHTWDPDAYRWMVNVESLSETIDFLESVGFEVEVSDSVNRFL